MDGQLKGSVGRYWISEETNWCEIGIVIYDSRYWSNGFGREAFQIGLISILITYVNRFLDQYNSSFHEAGEKSQRYQ
nr:GNAT family N-acetyltransferase [uncultured Brevibacillus sp.]